MITLIICVCLTFKNKWEHRISNIVIITIIDIINIINNIMRGDEAYK